MLLEKQQNYIREAGQLLGKQRSWKAKLLSIVSIDAFRRSAMLVSLKA